MTDIPQNTPYTHPLAAGATASFDLSSANLTLKSTARSDLEVEWTLQRGRLPEVTLTERGNGDLQVSTVSSGSGSWSISMSAELPHGNRANITVNGGNLDLSDLTASTVAHVNGGNITVSGASAALQLNTSGGAIKLHGCTASVTATSSGGGVTATFGAVPTVDMTSSGDDITVTVPPTAGFYLDAISIGGEVSIDRQLHGGSSFSGKSFKGPINGGGNNVSLKVHGGSIHVKAG